MDNTIVGMFIGQPQQLQDARGVWSSSIFRHPVTGPLLLHERGLTGDAVTDTANHGSPDQAVCCHPLAHYAYWNEHYSPAAPLGPGSVGENWTLASATEASVCIGDVYAVGDALVQVSAPRYPCMKQERKVGIVGFHQQTMATMRTGWYLRVLQPGQIAAGMPMTLVERPQPACSVQRVNQLVHGQFDETEAAWQLGVPELAAGWKRIIGLMAGRSAH